MVQPDQRKCTQRIPKSEGGDEARGVRQKRTVPFSCCETCEGARYLSSLDASLRRLFRVPTVAEVLGSLCVVGSTLVQLRERQVSCREST